MPLKAREIAALMEAVRRAGYRQFRLNEEGFLLEFDAAGEAFDAPQGASQDEPAETPSPSPVPIVEPRKGLVPVVAPMTGTFYRAPAPGEAPFVEVGGTVAASDLVCIIEVMKLFSSLRAGVAGDVVEICVENEGAVTAGEAVIWIKPPA